MVAWAAHVVFVSIATLTAALPAAGEEPPRNGTLTLVLENDFFTMTDRYYTSGLALLWVPGGRSAPGLTTWLARVLPWFPEDGPVHDGYALGQSIYTPRNIGAEDPPPGDRPYAGWLYVALGLGVETGRRLDQFAVTLGVVGPSSLTEESQTFVHSVTGSDEPRGWDTQLEDEFGILLTGQRSWRGLVTATLIGLDFDLALHLGGAIGNVYTYANAGLALRYGRGLALDYGPPRIQPSIQGSGSVAHSKRFAWYLFAGCEGRAVARNIFLDGNTFQDSRSVEKEPLVADLQWGVVLTWRGARLSYTNVVRTREFETQRGHGDFGAISLSVPL